MIILKLRPSGLGSQMLQYAMARCVSIKHGYELKLDISDVENAKYIKGEGFFHNGYELEKVFGLKCVVSHTAKMKLDIKLIFQYVIRKLRKSFKGLNGLSTPNLIRERNLEYEELEVPDNSYLEGYWISYKYYIDYINVLKKDFSFIDRLENKNSFIAQQIVESESVFVHVRRGDYITNQGVNAYIGTCDINYYRAAVKYIIGRIANPTFFVFSDDIVWARNNLDNLCEKIFFIDHNNNDESFYDMHLMSLCKHAVIANSSFSLWSAMLGSHDKGMVICPSMWTNAVSSDIVCPPEWIRINR